MARYGNQAQTVAAEIARLREEQHYTNKLIEQLIKLLQPKSGTGGR